MMAFALSYCILFCPVWLLSLRGSFISEGKQRKSRSGGVGRWMELGRDKGGEIVVGLYCTGEESKKKTF